MYNKTNVLKTKRNVEKWRESEEAWRESTFWEKSEVTVPFNFLIIPNDFWFDVSIFLPRFNNSRFCRTYEIYDRRTEQWKLQNDRHRSVQELLHQFPWKLVRILLCFLAILVSFEPAKVATRSRSWSTCFYVIYSTRNIHFPIRITIFDNLRFVITTWSLGWIIGGQNNRRL